MKLTLLASFLLFFFLHDGTQAESSSEEDNSNSDEDVNEALIEEDPEFDLLIFTQRWPITTCYEWREKGPNNDCGLPSAQNIWTIHGIWPTKLNTIGPSFCNKTAVFNVTELEGIEQQLEQFWINVEKNKPYDSLWRHEWLKHGTCAAAVMLQLNTEDKYFGQGLSWLQQHSMADVLGKGGILPGNNYTVVEIHQVLMDQLQQNAAIECYHDKATKHQFLNEIRVCFNKHLELENCDGILFENIFIDQPQEKLITNCNLNKPIIYPDTIPSLSNKKEDGGPEIRLEEYKRKKAQEKKTMKFWVNVYKLIQLLKWTTM